MDSEATANFEVFVRARTPALLRSAFLLTGDQQLAEDLVQSALARTHRSWDRLHAAGNAEAYTRRTMYHLQVSWWRRRRVAEVLPGTELHGTERHGTRKGRRPDDTDEITLRITLRTALLKLTAGPQPTVTSGSATPGPTSSGRSSAPASPGSTPNTATSTTIPAAAMLRAGDVGPGVTVSDDPTNDHGSIGMLLSYCGAQPDSWQNRVFNLGFRQRWLKSGDSRYVVQQVSRQPSDVARTLIPDAMAAFGGPCATVPIGGSQSNVSDVAVLPANWGEYSLMLRETPRDATRPVAWRIMIRQGDIVTEIRTSIPGFTETQARNLATQAAGRMCEATPTC